MKLALLAIAAPLIAQIANPLTTYFVPGTQTIGPYTSISISICNGSGVAHSQTAAELQREAAGHGIMLASNAQLLAAARTEDHRSWQRTALLAVESASWVMATATAGELIKIEERYKAAFPVAAGGIRFATTVIRPEPTEIPPTRPTVVQIAAGSCEELAVYGKIRGR